MAGKPGARVALAEAQSKAHQRAQLRTEGGNGIKRLTAQHRRMARRLAAEEAKKRPSPRLIVQYERELRLIDVSIVNWALEYSLPKPTSERVTDPSEQARIVAQREAFKPLTAEEWEARYGVKPGQPEPPAGNPELEAKMREIAAPKPKPKPLQLGGPSEMGPVYVDENGKLRPWN